MPIYEFRCRACQGKSDLFVKSVSNPLDPVCQHCGSKDMQRLVSTFATPLTNQQVHERSGPPPQSGIANPDYYKDPRNIGRWTEQQFTKSGMEMPTEIRDKIAVARESSMPPTERP